MPPQITPIANNPTNPPISSINESNMAGVIKKNDSSVDIKYKFCIIRNSMKAWKCYRCDLTFKEESHVFIHKDISRHPVQQIELIAA